MPALLAQATSARRASISSSSSANSSRMVSPGEQEPATAAQELQEPEVPLEPFPAAAGWQYRAEGGANVVISLRRQGRVLRFPKTQHAHPVARLHRLAEYRNALIAPLLREDSAVPWQVVRLSPSDRQQLVNAIEPLRPLRRRVDAVNTGGFALKMEDCAVFPLLPGVSGAMTSPAAGAGYSAPHNQQHVFSVEIKAKQGFLAGDDDLGVCSFCMKQYLKLKRGTVQQVSSYCPLDLFSGQYCRVDRALRALLDNPQNNLRVFLNGEYLYGARTGADRSHLLEAVAAALPEEHLQPEDRPRLLDLWTHLMFTILCTSDGECQPTSEELSETLERAGRCAPGPGPPTDSFLGRVLAGQRLAGAGPTQTAQLHDTVAASEEGRCRLEQAFSAPFSSAAWTHVLSTAAEAADPITSLQRYCLGATLRDCSLMITMRRLAGGEQAAGFRSVTDLAGNRWVCLCRVMDLDPKHIQRVTRQRLKKEKSRELYLRAQRPPTERSRPIACSVSDEGIDHLLAVSGSPM